MEQQTTDFLIASAWFALSLYCISANLLLFALIGSSVEMRTYTSYWIIISSSLCEISMSLHNLCFMIPATLLHDSYCRGDSTYSISMTALSGCIYYIEVVHIALMAVNRLLSTHYPTYYAMLFSSANTPFLLFLCYLVGIAVSVPMLTPCCYMLWDSYNYTSVPENRQSWYMSLDLCLNAVVLTVTIISYAAVLRKVYALRRSSTQFLNSTTASFQTSKEMRLLLQEISIMYWFFTTTVVYVATWIIWQSLTYMPQSTWIFFGMTTPIGHAINPTIYLIFNENLRRKLFDMIWRRPTNLPVVTMAGTTRLKH